MKEKISTALGIIMILAIMAGSIGTFSWSWTIGPIMGICFITAIILCIHEITTNRKD